MLRVDRHLLADAFEHHAWAMQRIIRFCGRLDETGRSTTGAYGTVGETLQHIIGSESFCRRLFTGDFLGWQWDDNAVAPFEQQATWAAQLAEFWHDLLVEGPNTQRALVHVMPDHRVRKVSVGLVLTQVLNHGAVHREQISIALSSAGIVPPDVSVWQFGRESGRDQVSRPRQTT